MGSLLRLLVGELGPAVVWIAIFVAAIIAVFTVYVGVAMVATLRCTDEQQRKTRYRVFRDLLDAFRSPLR